MAVRGGGYSRFLGFELRDAASGDFDVVGLDSDGSSDYRLQGLC